MFQNLFTFRVTLITCLLLLGNVLLAQQRIVNGKVTDSNNQPVVNASVTVKGSRVGTNTDQNGNYSLSVPANKNTIIVSYVGFEDRELSVSTGTANVALVALNTTLNDVLVTGYSSQRKKDITGAVSVVKVSDMVAVPAGSAEQQLQGRASGVTVSSSGQPGDGATVRIRGFGSLSNNNPLYIVDGIPLTNLGDLNSNDIETIQVLKDAASASQYGSRASNGVIVVTTKKGRAGALKVTYDAYYGTQARGKGYDLLDPQGNADLTFLALRNSGQVAANGNPNHPQYGNGVTPVLPDFILAGSQSGVKTSDPAADPSKYFLNLNDPNSSYLIVPANKRGTNWYNEVFHATPIMKHDIGLSGGSDKSRFYLGLDYFDQKGTVLTTFYKRYSVRANSEFNIKNRVRIGENLQMSYSNNIKIGNQSEGNEISLAYRIQPIVPVYDLGGNFAGQKGAGLGNALNPVAYRLRAKNNRNNDYKIIGNVYLEADLLRHLTARTSFGGEQYFNSNYYYGFKTYENSENNSTNEYNESASQNRSYTWTNQLSYKNTFGLHSVNLLGGVEAIEEKGRYIHAKRLGYFVDDPNFRSLNTGSGTQTNDGAPYPIRALFSQFAKASYIYNDKYILDATIRRDGSSVFGANHRYGIFPAGSVGWRISKEAFMQDVSWITDLKLRASYGSVGNQSISPDNAFSTFGGGLGDAYYDINGSSNSVVQGFRQLRIGNRNGKWETNTTQNLGFDAVLFKGNLEIVFDVYNKKTTDLLYVAPLISTTQGNATAPAVNIAAMSNKGIDLGLNYRGDLMMHKLKYAFNGTFTTYSNKIISLAEGVDYFNDGYYRQGTFARNQVGHPVSAFYGYKVIGFFQDAADVAKSPTQNDAAMGRYKYADIKKDGKIDDNDRTFLGNPNPKFTYGLNANLGYRNFDVDMFFYGVSGNDVINYTGWWQDYFSSFQGAKSKASLYDSWTPTHMNARLPIVENSSNFSNQQVFNSSLMEKGSFLRLKSVQLGYTLKKNVLGNLGIERLRFYVQGANLFTITKYRGLDPELVGGDTAFGIDYGNYPHQKQYLVGVNVTF